MIATLALSQKVKKKGWRELVMPRVRTMLQPNMHPVVYDVQSKIVGEDLSFQQIMNSQSQAIRSIQGS